MAWIFGIGIALRVLLIATTRGTSDVALWEGFVSAVQQHGITGAYAHAGKLNHPPLGALFVWGLHSLGPLAITLRVSAALADVGTALVAGKIAERLGMNGRFVAALFFLSPVAIFTSSFYCNTDSLLVFLVAVSVLLMLDGRHAAAGVAFACACGIKIVPALALPLLLLRGRMRFALGYGVAMAAIFLPSFARNPLQFTANVIGYAGSGQTWGLTLPATLAGAAGTVLHLPRFRGTAYALGDLYNDSARFFVVAIVALVTWMWARNPRPERLPAAVTLCFIGGIVAVPRATLGYYVWFLPMLPMTVPRRLTLAIHVVASLKLAFDYTLYSHGFPWRFADLGNTTDPWWLGRAIDVTGLPLWLLCIFALTVGTRALRRNWSDDENLDRDAGLQRIADAR